MVEIRSELDLGEKNKKTKKKEKKEKWEKVLSDFF